MFSRHVLFFVTFWPILSVLTLEPYQGKLDVPKIAARVPFGFAAKSTGGSAKDAPVYVVTTTAELKQAVKVAGPKTIYVKGILQGNQLNDGTLASCQSYIDTTGSQGAAIRQYNFTQYLQSLNSTYMALVKDAASKNQLFEGKNATEYASLLSKMNGWRPVVSQTQKAQVAISLNNDTSLIGLDSQATLNGINLKLSSVNNVWIRNLKIIPPQDCFPAPETLPSSWNANYDALSLVASTNVWVDGCVLQDSLNGDWVKPDNVLPGYEVDRFDGLFDCEDGTDFVTFSHNIVRNHHKSLLLGGGSKEADRDLGKMRFTIFGNHFNSSASRNPLMRFGTYDLTANIFQAINDKQPLFSVAKSGELEVNAAIPSAQAFSYHIGIYNQSRSRVADNVFVLTGPVPSDTSRLFTLSEDTSAALPARVCIPEGSFKQTLNGSPILPSLGAVVKSAIEYYKPKGKVVDGGVLLTCDGVVTGYSYPVQYKTAQEVQAYVLANSGQKNQI